MGNCRERLGKNKEFNEKAFLIKICFMYHF